jgi:hypothetical protein
LQRRGYGQHLDLDGYAERFAPSEKDQQLVLKYNFIIPMLTPTPVFLLIFFILSSLSIEFSSLSYTTTISYLKSIGAKATLLRSKDGIIAQVPIQSHIATLMVIKKKLEWNIKKNSMRARETDTETDRERDRERKRET